MPKVKEKRIEHKYVPRGTQKQLLEDRSAELLVAGPAGTGKSRACLEKLHLLCLLNPGMRGLIVRKTQVSMTSTALVTFREQVVKEAMETGEVTWYGGSQAESAMFRYRNGSVVVVGGMDKSTKIMSSEYDFCYIQEATELTIEDWEAISTRLRNGVVSFQQLLADTNPDTPTHWLKVRCDEGKTKILESRHEENPRLFNEDGTKTPAGIQYMGRLDDLTGVRHKRLRLGLWVAADGQIYETWDPQVHLVDAFDIPADWPRFWSIDFGFTNPFVCQFWAQDPDGRVYLYREIFMTQRQTIDHGNQILSLVRRPDGSWKEPKPQQIICDHDAEGRAVLERAIGLTTVPAKKQVLEGIDAVQTRLRVQEDGKPRLFIVRDALVERDRQLAEDRKPTCTQDEMVGYVWDVGAGKNPKEQPLKRDDHGMDAMRYLVAQLDLVSQVRVRFIDAGRRGARSAW